MPYRVEQIEPSKTVMIVVDMQNDFVAEGAALRSAQAAAMVPKLAATLKFCREQGIRVVYTAHVHRRDGSDMGMYDDLYPPIADRSCSSTERRALRSLVTWHLRQTNTSSRSTATALSSPRTSTSSCENGESRPSSFREPLLRTAVMPLRETRCSTIIKLSSCRT